jgi:hypothetical protein
MQKYKNEEALKAFKFFSKVFGSITIIVFAIFYGSIIRKEETRVKAEVRKQIIKEYLNQQQGASAQKIK